MNSLLGTIHLGWMELGTLQVWVIGLIVSSFTIDIFDEIYTFDENRNEIYTFYENRYEIYIFYENRYENCTFYENRYEIDIFLRNLHFLRK